MVSLVVVLHTWVCDNWAYQFPNAVQGMQLAIFILVMTLANVVSADTAWIGKRLQRGSNIRTRLAKPPNELQESLGPSGPEIQQKV